MTKPPFFSAIAHDLAARAAEATISLLSPASQTLRSHLAGRLKAPAGAPGSYLAAPVFEALFDWERDPRTMDHLAALGMLPPALVAAMHDPPAAHRTERFDRDWHPYAHQVRAWTALAGPSQRSAIITTGTASGKTECFLVPILADLVNEIERSHAQLEGVRALFLYPLNALINSQRDRLAAWTSSFGQRMRFCLYNGATPNEAPGHRQASAPSQVLSRRELRASPPPILVTNATMLEFMMVRSEDAPIISRSQGKLRWVVLDEAHTYVGSTAAEIALLLRRVLHAFGVSPRDVRFVATSATIGSGEDTRSRLQAYLADLAGVALEQVVVVEGARSRPPIPPMFELEDQPLPRASDLDTLSDHEVYRRLACASRFRAARACLQDRPRCVDAIADALGLAAEDRTAETLRLMDHASRASLQSPSPDGESQPLLPMRLHLFMRTQQGLFACCNTRCGHRPVAEATQDWWFGAVYLERRLRCEHCDSLVMPIVFCSTCGEAYLSAKEEAGHLIAADWSATEIDAEEAPDIDELLEDEPASEIAGQSRLLAGPTGRNPGHRVASYLPRTGELVSGGPDACLWYEPPVHDGVRCGRCGERESSARELFRPTRAGAPFYLGVAIPTILSHLPFNAADVHLPAAGRKLITFTDSRAGTARFALKTQLEAERNFVRARIYHLLWSKAVPSIDSSAEEATLRRELARQTSPVIRQALSSRLDAIEEQRRAPELSWEAVRDQLANDKTVSSWMRESLINRYVGAVVGEREMADIVMLRELMRRPKRQSSLETLGLVRLRYPALEQTVTDAPVEWLARGPTLAQWRDFLTLIIDFFVRGRGAVLASDNVVLRWMGVRFGHPEIVAPGEPSKPGVAAAWPIVHAKGRVPRLARLLAHGLGLDVRDGSDRDLVNELLRRAWRDVMRSKLLDQGPAGFRLDLKHSMLVALTTGYLCPVTRRVLGTTLLGRSPFQPERWTSGETCAPVEMPRLRYPFGTEDGYKVPELVQRWLRDDPTVAAARALGAWTDFSDQIATFHDSLFFQTGEHSAQQSRQRLDQLERTFKSGYLNVLSCSTTMELGVNLGDLMAVGLNNTPPGPANYLQRAGRSARRRQQRAVAFTMCQGTAHGEAVFRDPTWPFTARLNVPAVSLRSDRIVVRHIHSLFLSYFLRHSGLADAQRLKCGAFFVGPAGGMSPSEAFLSWIETEAAEIAPLRAGLTHLLARTLLDGAHMGLFEQAAQALLNIRDRWIAQHDALRDELVLAGGTLDKSSQGSAVARAIAIQLRRLTDEYLLRFLVTEGFLPAYGFPLNVVPFVTTTAEQLKAEQDREEDTYGQVRGYPSRHVSQALNEYAPGNAVVIDGVVYKSSGVTLSWHRPPGDGTQREIQAIRRAWRCRSCGATGIMMSGQQAAVCTRCEEDDDIAVLPFLSPSGFAVNIRDKPHNDLSQVQYIPRIPAWLSANAGSWLPLSTAGIGRYRYDPNGFVLQHSRGLTGHGYAICLHCGFASAEDARPKGAASGDLPGGFDRHRRLRGGKSDDQTGALCAGAGGGFGVLRHHHLGSDSCTDILELQLAYPAGGGFIADTKVACSLAVALREAVARHLNIDVREIGWHVKRSADPPDGRRSILLYDVADGGAGYVGNVPDAFPEVLDRARSFLRCPRDCDGACHACLLAFDTAEFSDKLDRHLALAYLTDDVLRCAGLPDHDQVFGPNTTFEPSALTTACLLRVQRVGVDELRIHIGGPSRDASIGPAWPLWGFLVRWRTQSTDVCIIATRSFLNGLTWQDRNALANHLEATGIELRQVEQPVVVGDRFVALEIGGRASSSRWAVSDASTLVPGEVWGQPSEPGGSVRLHAEEPLAGRPGRVVAASEIRCAIPGTFVAVTVGTQLNGDVKGFGARLFGQLGRPAPGLISRLKEAPGLNSLQYSDRYLRSPLSVRLLAEVLRHLTSLPGGLTAQTAVLVRSTHDDRGDGGYQSLTSNWPTAQIQREVTRLTLARLLQRDADVELVPRGSLPHHRFLRLDWADGKTAEIRFDQGLSGMQIFGRVSRFDMHRTAARQADELLRLAINVEPVPPAAPPIYVMGP